MKGRMVFLSLLLVCPAVASPVWLSYGPPRGAECVLEVSQLQERCNDSVWILPKEMDLAVRSSLSELGGLLNLLEEGKRDWTEGGERRVRVEIDVGDIVDPLAVRRRMYGVLVPLTTAVRRSGWEGPFFVADSENEAASRNAMLLNGELEHPSEVIAREVVKESRWGTDGIAGRQREWIADLSSCPAERIERSSNKALAWGAQGCFVRESGLPREDLWVWRNLAPFEWALPGVGLMGNEKGISILERVAQESHIAYLYPFEQCELESCGAVFVMGDPPLSLVEGLEKRVEKGLLLAVFLGVEPMDALSRLLNLLGCRFHLNKGERIPSFVSRAEGGRLEAWQEVRVRSLYRPSHLPKGAVVEAQTPDGRDVAWSWSRGKGRVFILQMPEDDDASLVVLRRWVECMAKMVGCTPSMHGPPETEGILLRSEGQLFLLVRAEGMPGGLLRCRATLPWAKEDSIYRFWRYPGPKWVGSIPGKEALSEGMSLEVPMGGALLLQVTEHEGGLLVP